MLNRLRYILLILVLFTASQVKAQYIIDSVCQGASRNYKVVGEPGSVYQWTITNPAGVVVTLPQNTPEILNYVWTQAPGKYSMKVVQYSALGCDSIQQGDVIIVNPAFAFAGNNATICSGMVFKFLQDTVANCSALRWTTSGDGKFSVDSILHPIYTPGPADIAAGSVILSLTADGLGRSGSCIPAVSTVTLNIKTLTATALSTPVSCFGGSNGSITVSATGGNTPYTYTVGTNSNSTGLFSGLPAGLHTFTVIENNGCSVTDTVSVASPVQLAISYVKLDITCKGSMSGKIDLSVTGGTQPYRYLWSTGDTLQDIANRPAGTYSVVVTDAKGCSATSTITLDDAIAIAISETHKDVSCNGNSDGSINITVNGGRLPYAFLWSNGDTTANVSKLIAGTYKVVVTDSLGCADSLSVTIIESSNLALAEMHTDAGCKGASNGSINLEVIGGVKPFNYLWSNADTTQNLIGLAAGLYSVAVTDSLGCIATLSVTLSEAPAIVLSESHTDVNCFGGNNGSITINVSGGTKPYTYLWSNGAKTQNIDTLSAGTYRVLVTDSIGCSDSLSVIINQSPAIALTETHNNVGCVGKNSGSINLSVTGGLKPYRFAWNTGDTIEDISSLSAGSYNVTVTDSNSCTSTLIVVITEAAGLVLTETHTDALCFGSKTGSINLSVSGGTSPYTYTWNTGDTIQDITNLAAGNYKVVVTDSIGCVDSLSVIITQSPDIELSASHTNAGCSGLGNGSIDLTVLGGVKPYTYAWSNLQTTQDINTLSAGTYSVTVTDSVGCTAVLSVVITNSPALTIHAVPTHVKCFGGNTGSIALTVSGGVTPFTYEWNNGGISRDIANLTAGTYKVIVTDSIGCSDSLSVAINQAAELLLSETHTGAGCNGSGNGSIDLTVTGGIAPYTYLWSNGDSVQDIFSLVAGVYEVIVSDSNACSAKLKITVSEAAGIVLAETHTNASCNGSGNGSIDLIVSGGIAPFTYLWNNGDTTQDSKNLVAGQYTVTLTDSLGCKATLTIAITESSSIVLTETHTNVSCNASATGSIDLTVIGGTKPYTYVWSNSETSQDVDTLSAGVYSVVVTDSLGCSASLSIIVEDAVGLDVTSVHTNVTCSGGNNGSVKLTITGGVAPYSYLWSNGETTQNINNLVSGVYKVKVTDAAGCSDSLSVTVTEPAIVSLSAIHSDAGCNGSTNGSIDLTVSGGTQPYKYMWSTGDTTQDISALAAGSYSVSVADSNGCTSTLTVVIKEATGLALSEIHTNASCNGNNDGSINLTVTGGTKPYHYAWSTGDTIEDINKLVAGLYTVTVTDSIGCKADLQVTIVESAIITLNAIQKDAACYGSATGSITLTVNGGTKPFTYLWSNSQTTKDISALKAGIYNVTVTDSLGCTANLLVTINEATALSLTHTKTDVSCNGGNNGSINLAVAGGTKPYTYLWSNALTTKDIISLSAGIYKVVVTDSVGCVDSLSVTINEKAALSVTEVHKNIGCNGGNSGNIDLTVIGGTQPYHYLWNTGDTLQDIDSLVAGVYNVTVTDSVGCVATLTVTLTEATKLALTSTHTNASCNGNNDGSINLTVTGGTKPYHYAWSTGDTIEDINKLVAGLYTVTVTDSIGCKADLQVTIVESAIITLSETHIDATCYGSATGSIILTVNGGTKPFTYLWSNSQTTKDISALKAGIYNVTVTDSLGCNATLSIIINEATALSLTHTKTDVSCNSGNNGSINLTVTGGTKPYTYLWSNALTTKDISSLSAGIYKVVVTDSVGCVDSLSVTINEKAALSVTEVHKNIGCNGANTGSIDLTVVGGTQPYHYVWSTGDTLQDIASLVAGVYNVSVTDSVGCIASLTVTLTEATKLALTSTHIDASCNGNNDGSINLTVTGGTQSYHYAWSTGDTIEDINKLVAGLYTVTVTDSIGCKADLQVTIVESATITLSAIQKDAACYGSATGSITLTVNGGTKPFTYLWSNSQTTKDISALKAGIYNVTVTDSLGCNATLSITINEATALSLTSAKTDVSCNGGNNGSINLAVTGGTKPYTYLWSNALTTEDISSLSAGIYKVVVTDSVGCVDSLSVTINEKAALSVTEVHKNIGCNGANTGSIDLTVVGGTQPYHYVYSTGDTLQDITSLVAGTYNVTVTDSVGCVATLAVTLTEATKLALTSAHIDASCNGNNDGSINISVSGGKTPYTFGWNTGAITEDISNLKAGIYTLVVTDSVGCTSTITDTIIEASVLNITEVHINAGCFGSANGNIKVNVTGGKLPYSFKWNNGDTTQIINNLIAGIYTVTVKDSSGCMETLSLTITDSPELSSSAIVTDISCYGGVDGSINLTVSGGTKPFAFTWNNGAVTEDISNLSAGNYKVIITDSIGCVDSLEVAVNQATLLAVTETHKDIVCNGNNNGSIDLTVVGGTMPYQFKWNTGETTQNLSSLAAGSYSVDVTDAKGCKASLTISITQATSLVLTETHIESTCNGNKDGSINLTVSGGVLPYKYMWNTGDTLEDINSLKAGVYTVTVTDSVGCAATLAVTIIEASDVSISETHVNAGCFGSATGSITIDAKGGKLPFRYLWSTGDTTQILSNLVAGIYTVTVTDVSGCAEIVSINITDSPKIALSVNATDVKCAGNNSGFISLDVTGGASPYTYKWSNGAATKDISNLIAGVYKVIVTDFAGCSDSLNVTIKEPSALVLTETHINAGCSGNKSGSIDLTVVGGTQPFKYVWSSGDTTQDLSGLNAGTYTIVVSDANGCTASTSVLITETTSLNVAQTHIEATCNGNSDGSINLTVTGGTKPYTYSWSNGATTEDISNLPAGIYTVIVTDSIGCSVALIQTIIEGSNVKITETHTNAGCSGTNTGSISLQVTGGKLPYKFNWSNGNTTQNISNLTAGTYSVIVTDSSGCNATLNITIQDAPALVLSSTVTDAGCFGDNKGNIKLNVTGGTKPYTYTWSNGSASEDLNGLFAGMYKVKVTDAIGCSDTLAIFVKEASPIVLSETHWNTGCNGGSNGSINLTVTGGVPDYTYSWSNGSKVEDISDLLPGTYTVTVTDKLGCSKTLSVVIKNSATTTVSVKHKDVSCAGESNGSIDLTVTGGVKPYSYQWSNGLITEDLTGLAPGVYSVAVTDGTGCNNVVSVTIDSPAELVLTADHKNATCFGSKTGSASVKVIGGKLPYTYLWSNGAKTSSITNVASGKYTVFVADSNNCTKSLEVIITQPLEIVVTPTANTTSCSGSATGSISLDIKGGVMPYSVSWNTGAKTKDITGLSAGKYTATVTDSVGCSVVAVVTVQDASAILLTATSKDALCKGAATGSIDLTVNGGTKPYTFSWNNGLTTEDIMNVSAGVYTVTVTDAIGCSASLPVTVKESAGITIKETITHVECNGGNTGAISLVVSGGRPTYNFLWDGGNTTHVINGLKAGTYNVTVTDSAGCPTVKSIVVNENPAITINPTVTNVSCFLAYDGKIDLSVSGGVKPYTYSWTSGETTSSISDLLPGTYHVDVTDKLGCTTGLNITVSSPERLTLRETHINTGCNNSAIGSIDLTVLGGTYPYTYKWSNGKTTEDINTLKAGTYTVIVTDKNKCEATLNVTIIENNTLAVTETHTNISCYGGNEGSISLAITGGVKPVTCLWNTGATTTDLTGLKAGTYHAVLTDANSCTFEIDVIITEPAVLTINDSVVPAYCNGGFGGAIYTRVTGGTAPYAYEWNIGKQTKDITNLRANEYFVKVIDSNGCTVEKTIFVTESKGLTLTASVTNPHCTNSDGKIDLNVTNGLAPFTYSWSNGAKVEDISGLVAGVYKVDVTDSRGCTGTIEVNLISEAGLSLSAVSQKASCIGVSNGSIDLTVTNGTAPFVYAWSNGAKTEDISGLAAGTYSVKVTDAVGCFGTLVVTLESEAGFVLSAVSAKASCKGVANGSIDLTVTGGKAPYFFSWSNGAITEDISSLLAGSYKVSVTDSNGCSDTLSVVVGSGAGFTLAEKHIDASCSGIANGSIEITATGGTAPYTYLWSNGATTAVASNLLAGKYQVVVTDTNGCQEVLEVIIKSISEIIVKSVSSDVKCNGGNDGSIDLTVTGGTSPYTFAWSNKSTSQNIAQLTAGMYSVVVTDINGCNASITDTVSQPQALAISVTSVNASCSKNNGSISVAATGGKASYQYSNDNGLTWQVSPVFTKLSVGAYTIKIKDSNGCEMVYASNPVVLSDTPGPTITGLTVTNAVEGGKKGSVIIAAKGNGLAVQYSLDSISWQSDSTFNGLVPNMYTAYVRTASGCVETMTFEVKRIVIGKIQLTSSSKEVCLGVSLDIPVYATSGFTNISAFHVELSFDTTILDMLTVNGINTSLAGGKLDWEQNDKGVISIDFESAPGTLVSIPMDNLLFAIQFNSLAPGLGKLSWNEVNCTFTALGTYSVPSIYTIGKVQILPMPKVAVAGEGDYCVGDILTLTTRSLDANLNYEWKGPKGLANTGEKWSLGNLTLDESGQYSLVVTNSTNGLQCQSQVDLQVIVHPNPIISISTEDTLCFDQPSLLLDADPSGKYQSYLWQDNSTMPSLTATEHGTYWVNVTDNFGCQGQDTVVLRQCRLPIWMPNIFSPNGDGLNDKFEATYDKNIKFNFKMLIFNKWGEQIYVSTDITKGWDGTYKGLPCPSDLYSWIVYFDAPAPYMFTQKSPIKGTVMLLK